MAVVVTVAKGYDLGYVWKNQGRADAEKASGGYYIDAVQAGEPPGRWWGPGARALGFAEGRVVERRPYDAVYQQRDPRTGAKLGRPRGRYARFADHLARLKAAEPHATAERVIELEREAAQATRQPAAYTDVTVSFSKSISVLHASIRVNARRARLAGDEQAAAYWAAHEEKFQQVLQRANRAALEYVQAWAGVTRTGPAPGVRPSFEPRHGNIRRGRRIVLKPSTRAGRRFGSQPHRTSPDATPTRNARSDGLYKAAQRAVICGVGGASQQSRHGLLAGRLFCIFIYIVTFGDECPHLRSAVWAVAD